MSLTECLVKRHYQQRPAALLDPRQVHRADIDARATQYHAYGAQRVQDATCIAIELVKKIADQQERMPRKSTYFYPKPPTGLVAYALD